MKKILLTLGILGSLMFSACGKSKDMSSTDVTSSKKETTFIMGSSNFNGDFYEGWTNSIYDDNIRKLVWGGGLLTQTDKGQLVANSFVKSKTLTKSDPSKEAPDVWSFKIKNGMKFSNGDSLTAKDVKFTYDFFMNKKALGDTGGTSSLDQYIDTVIIDEDTNTVTLKLKAMIYTIDNTVFTVRILDSTAITEGAEKAGVTVQQYVKNNMNDPVGYGPYKIDEYVESQYVKLSINKNYQGNFEGDKPSIDHLIVQNIPQETKITQLVTGKIDGLSGLVSEESIDAVKNDENTSTSDYFRHGGGQFTFHSDFGPVQIPEVRKAFAYEFNRIKFRSIFLGKYGISSNAPYSRNMWMMYDKGEELGSKGEFEKSLTSYDLLDVNGKWDEAANLAATHKLLDQAVKRSDGIYAKLTKSGDKYLWNGEELTLNIAATSSWIDAINLTLTEAIQSEFGIKVKTESMDWSILANNLYGNAELGERKYHMFAGAVSYTLKDDPYSNWSKTLILPYGKGSSVNSARFVGDEELLDKIRFANPTTDEGTVNYKANWRKWIVEVNKELPILPLYSNNYYDAYTNRVVDFETNALWQWPYAIVKAKFK